MPKKKIAIFASLSLLVIILFIIILSSVIGNSNKKVTNIIPYETVVVPQSQVITANNFEQLTEQAVWGNGHLNDASLSADKNKIAIASSFGAFVFDTKSDQLVYTFNENECVNTVDFSTNGSMIAIGSEDGLVSIYSTVNGRLKYQFDAEYAVQKIKFSPNNEMIAASTNQSGRYLWNLKTKNEQIDGQGRGANITSIAFSPDGSLVAFGANNGDANKNSLLIWGIDSHTYKSKITLKDPISGLQFSPDNTTLAVTSDQDIKFFDLPDGRIEIDDYHKLNNDYITTWEFTETGLEYMYVNALSLAYSPDGKELACGYSNGEIRFFNVKNGKVNKIINDHMIAVNTIEYSVDGKSIIATSADNITRIINANSHKITSRYGRFSGQITSMAFSPDGSLLASAGSDGAIIIRQTSDGQVLQRLAGHTKIVRGISFSREGDYLFSASTDKTVLKWRVSDGKLMKVMDEYDTGFITIATLPDGFLLGDIPLVATSSYDGAFQLWGVPKGNLIRTLESPNRLHWANDLEFSPDGMYLAGGMSEGSLQLWRPISGELIVNAQLHDKAIHSLAFSSDSASIATGSVDNTIIFWKFKQISTPVILGRHGDDVMKLYFIDNDQYLLSAAKNGQIYLWDINSRKQIASVDNPYRDVDTISLSPDGTLLAIALPDGTVHIWSVRQ